MQVNDHVAVVTGAASGIGKATAKALAAAGTHVVLADIDREKGQAVEEEITAEGGTAKYAYLDVTDAESIGAFKQEVLEWRPYVDIVVNVAGWGRIQPFMENSPEFWSKVVNLNLMGPIAVTRAFLDGMIERRWGKVVIVSSDAGRVGSLGETVYAAAKGGAIAFTKSLAREMARFNITINSVCPGPTDTPLLAAVPEKHQDAFVRATPMRRLARPDEIADAVAYFASDRSSFVTGQVLSVSGGLTMAG